MKVQPRVNFYSFEGVDAAGKTTQLHLIEDYLQSQGYPVVTTREPGGSTGAEEIRNLLVSGDKDRWSSVSEALLFMAARVDHIEHTISPALASGKIVLTDRFYDSSLVYQGAQFNEAPGVTFSTLVTLLNEQFLQFGPAKTFYLRISPETSQQRLEARGEPRSRFEQRGQEFVRNCIRAYDRLAELYPERIVVIDANQTADLVHFDVQAEFNKHLGISNLTP